MTITDLIALIRDGGTLAVLLIIIVTGMRGDWTWRWYSDELRARITDLEQRLDRALSTAEKGATQAGRATELAEREQRGRGVR